MGKAYEDFQKRQAWIQSEDDAMVRVNQPKQELSESFPLLDTLVVEPLPQVKIVEPAAVPMQAQAPSTDTRKSWEQSHAARVARGDDKGAAEAKKQIRKIELAEKATFIAKARELKNLAKASERAKKMEERRAAKLGRIEERRMKSVQFRFRQLFENNPGQWFTNEKLAERGFLRYGGYIYTLKNEGFIIDKRQVNGGLWEYGWAGPQVVEGCSDGQAA